MHEIIKEFNDKYNFWVISCPEGCRITSWKEGDDILEYTSFEIAYAPANADLTIYHCVSVEMDERLVKEQMDKVREMED